MKIFLFCIFTAEADLHFCSSKIFLSVIMKDYCEDSSSHYELHTTSIKSASPHITYNRQIASNLIDWDWKKIHALSLSEQCAIDKITQNMKERRHETLFLR